LKDFDRSSRFSPEEQAALRFAEKITLTPTSNAGAEADALQSLFSDQQRVDIVATVALANLTNRISDGLGLDFEFAPEKI